MSEQIKYEAVFGPQELFDYAPFDCIFVVRLQDGNKVYYGEYPKIKTEPLFVVQSDYIKFAMRRIIKTPVWTVADQQAGRLPEVGCRVNFCHKLNTNWRTGEIKYIDDQVAVIKADAIDRPFVYEVDRVEFKPIESQEEKAQRLRMEWCNEAGLVCSLGMTTLTRIYDAMLSGELKMPEVQ